MSLGIIHHIRIQPQRMPSELIIGIQLPSSYWYLLCRMTLRTWQPLGPEGRTARQAATEPALEGAARVA